MDVLTLALVFAPFLAGGLLTFAGVAVSIPAPEFKIAKLLVHLALAPMFVMDVLWGATTTEPPSIRIAVAAIIGAVVSFAYLEVLSWIRRREERWVREQGLANEPAA